MRNRKWGLALFIVSAAVSAADFDAAGRLTSVTHDGTTIPILAGLVVELGHGKSLPVAPTGKVKLARDGDTWRGTVKLPRGTANLDLAWTDIPGKLRLKGVLRAADAKPLPIEGVDYVVHLAQDRFAGGQVLRVQSEDGGAFRSPVRLPAEASASKLVDEKSSGVTFLDARKNWSVGLQLPEAREISVAEIPGSRPRTLEVRIRLHDGALEPGVDVPIALTLSVVGTAAAPAPPSKPN